MANASPLLHLEGTARDWATGLAAPVGFLAKKSPMPALTFGKLAATPASVMLEVTNLETSYRGPVPLVVTTPGEVLVPLKRLYDLITHMSDEALVTLTETARQLQVTSEQGHWSLPKLPVLEYPQAPDLSASDASFTLPASTLVQLLETAGYAWLRKAELRQTLGAVLLTCGAHGISVVTTDGHRLAYAATLGASAPVEAMLAGDAAEVVAAWLKKCGDEPVTVAQREHMLAWTCAGVMVQTRLLEGVYPEWQRVIPDDDAPQALIPLAPWMAALERGATQQTHRELDGTQLTLYDDLLIVETCVTDNEICGREEFACRYQGDVQHVLLRSTYLHEALYALRGTVTDVCLTINGPLTPIKLTNPAAPDSGSAVLMGTRGSRPATSPRAALAGVESL